LDLYDAISRYLMQSGLIQCSFGLFDATYSYPMQLELGGCNLSLSDAIWLYSVQHEFSHCNLEIADATSRGDAAFWHAILSPDVFDATWTGGKHARRRLRRRARPPRAVTEKSTA
jgi:hypothetical protein